MPGVLLDDMAFSLDSVSAASSSLFESPSSSYNHLSHYLLNSSSPSDTKCFHYEPQTLLESIMASVSTSDSPRGSSDSARVIPCGMLDTRLSPPGSTDSISDSPRSGSGSPRSLPCGSFDSALHRFLPSNNTDEATWSAEDVYSCDEFRMFEFKVRRCMRGRSHDWTECPFAHPGEKARRRDPRRFHYSGTACPDFRKGSCKNGDSCELAHGVFECWLHPARYRTQQCKDGRSCKRRVCFFAHTLDQLRLLPSTADSPVRSSASSSPRKPLHKVPVTEAEMKMVTSCSNCSSNNGKSRIMASPTSILSDLSHSPPPLSPPLSPSPSPPLSPSQARRRSCGFVSAPASPGVTRGSISELVNALQQLEVQKSPAVWPYSTGPSPLRHGTTTGSSSVSQCTSMSLPCTPTNRSKWETMWEMEMDEDVSEETITSVPRVESGRDLRAKIYGRLAGRAEAAAARLAQGGVPGYAADITVNDPCPDINWVNELVTE